LSIRRKQTGLITLATIGVFLSMCLSTSQALGQAVPFTDMVDKTFVIEAKVMINERGGFVKGYPTYKQIAGDAASFDLMKMGLASFESDGYFQYLSNLGGKEMSLKVEQDGVDLTITCQVELATENRAKSVRSGVSLAVDLAKSSRRNGPLSPREENELLMMSNVKLSTDKNSLLINFAMPKAEFWRIMDDAVASLY
jgi:hypothetical protein